MKLSIIVPCYNVSQFLERCLMSLINQTLTDMEIICIDDKSTDDTLAVLKNWEKGDLRIRVIENDENMGVGYTRNRGIDLAKGEFVGFVDPDDWVDANFFEKLIDVAEKTQTPVVCGDVYEYEFLGGRKKIKRKMKKSWHNFRYHYSAVYLREFLDRFNICYPHLCIGEDIVFETMVKLNTPKPILYVPGIAYHYCRRPGSLNEDVWREKQTEDFITAMRQLFDLYNLRDGIKNTDYIAGVHYYFRYLYVVAFYKSIYAPDKVVNALCELFPAMRMNWELLRKNKQLYYPLYYGSADGVRSILKAQRWKIKEYKLFGAIKIAVLKYNDFEKELRIFGIPVFVIKH